jgi:hypothetical protein
MPVSVQVFSLLLIRNSIDGVRAVAAMAVFAAVVLSVWVTRYFLNTDPDKPLAPPALAPHIRTGLIRLYLILLIPWAAWFSYRAYEANDLLNFDFAQGRHWGELQGMLENSATSAARIEYARSELGHMALVWDAKTNDEIAEHIEEAEQINDGRLTTAIYALLAAIMPPLLYPIFLWALAGFRKSTPGGG